MNALRRIAAIAVVVWLGIARRKDVYVLLILSAALLAALASLNAFGLGGMSRYVADVGLLLAWVFAMVLAVTFTSRELPAEERQGTIFPLLAKPVSRFDLVAGKWAGCWSAAAAATLVFYLLVLLFVRGKGGALDPATLLQAYALHVLALGVIVAAVLLFSTRLSPDAAATLGYVAAVLAWWVSPRIPALLAHARGSAATAMLVLYHSGPHLELMDMRKRLVHDYGPIEWPLFGAVAGYGLAWTAALLLAAWSAYRRKRFSRGDLAV